MHNEGYNYKKKFFCDTHTHTHTEALGLVVVFWNTIKLLLSLGEGGWGYIHVYRILYWTSNGIRYTISYNNKILKLNSI